MVQYGREASSPLPTPNSLPSAKIESLSYSPLLFLYCLDIESNGATVQSVECQQASKAPVLRMRLGEHQGCDRNLERRRPSLTRD